MPPIAFKMFTFLKKFLTEFLFWENKLIILSILSIHCLRFPDIYKVSFCKHSQVCSEQTRPQDFFTNKNPQKRVRLKIHLPIAQVLFLTGKLHSLLFTSYKCVKTFLKSYVLYFFHRSVLFKWRSNVMFENVHGGFHGVCFFLVKSNIGL